MVWEDPPTVARGPGAERSALRKEVDSMLAEIKERPEQWARLYDFGEKDEAEKRGSYIRSVVEKGWNVAVRHTEYGWSVFARLKDPNGIRKPKTFQE